MTRAREELVLTAARERLLYGNYQTNLPSRFLGDIDAEFDTSFTHSPSHSEHSPCHPEHSPCHPELVSGSHSGLKIPKQVRDDIVRLSEDDIAGLSGDDIAGLSRPDTTEPRFVPDEIELSQGDKVHHKIFGVGFVEQIEGQVVAVRFPTGLKKLNVSFAPLEKI
jgi:hypothetical protein